ncbi:AAEL013584-PA [Aedes aegypti]|uniref:AAEL013584-PA n=1 Tax=Aedes aegypti TaxID=7159 RepID=Q16IQ2_AEDAE|nr:AAEL013584-PA [Aedes aegypti]
MTSRILPTWSPVDKFGRCSNSLPRDRQRVPKSCSDTFRELKFSAVWDQFFALDDVKDVLNYLEEADLAAYDALNTVADFLGLHHVKPTVRNLNTRSLNGFVEEVLALLPLKEFESLFEDKLQTSPEFQAFFEKLRTLDYTKFVDLYHNSKEVQSFLQKLRNYGVDVDGFFDLVSGFFGWGKY